MRYSGKKSPSTKPRNHRPPKRKRHDTEDEDEIEVEIIGPGGDDAVNCGPDRV